ncbi:MAG: prepilin-type N-terminal cleavage/methylation domain-containing protein, partial [Massilia sp.]
MKPLSQRRAGGFSLIELLVSVVVGLLALMFATRLVVGGEQGRQAALGGSDSMQNGMVAMFSIRADAEQAGYGLNDPLVIGCSTQFSDTLGYALPSVPRGLANVTPLGAAVIEQGAASAADGDGADRISLFAGTSLSGTGTLRINTDYAAGTPLVVDRVPYGFRQGDVVVVAPEQPGTDCALAQITSDPSDLGAPPASQTIDFQVGTDYRFNRANLGATFKGGVARMFNLGPAGSLPFHTWSVDDGLLKLRATNLSGAAATPQTVLDNVVSIKAQYGFDTRAGA